MKIAYFAGTMRPDHDGVTRVLYRMSHFLNSKKIEYIFFSPIVPENSDELPAIIFKVPSTSIPLYDDYRIANPFQHTFSDQLDSFEPDVIHIHSPCTLGLAALRYGKEHGVPVVATYHTHFASYARYYHLSLLEPGGWTYFRYLYNQCDKIFVPSLPILDELRLQGIHNLQYIPHGVDTTVFNPKHFNPQWKTKLNIEGKYALLFAGRLVWEKDLLILAQTYSLLEKKRNDLAFVIAGDGPIRDELQKLMPNAIFTGHLSGSSLSEAYASSDLFIFPSTTETFGNVTLEAMASGIVPICADKGGATGIITDGVTGLLVPPRNADEFASKIEMILEQSERRILIANGALEYAQKQTWDNSFDQMLQSYSDMLKIKSYFTHINYSFQKIFEPTLVPTAHS